jgi:alpha-tubulin suppressor-like RCC1 family protein
LLVKNDGTLWRWGTNLNFKNGEWPGLRTFTPQRLGTESNWAEVFLADHELCLRKNDGSLWTQWNGNQKEHIELEPGFSVGRTPLFERSKWRGMTTAQIGSGYYLGVFDDGTFRLWADQKLNNQSHSFEWTEENLQFGTDKNWRGVAGRGEKIVTLKNDGTLWLWNFHHDNRRGWDPARDEREMVDAKAVRLGTHSDWIGITSGDGGIISLAADGSIWHWPLEDAAYYLGESDNHNNADNSHFEPLLDVSRKPQLLGNVFSNTH